LKPPIAAKNQNQDGSAGSSGPRRNQNSPKDSSSSFPRLNSDPKEISTKMSEGSLLRKLNQVIPVEEKYDTPNSKQEAIE